MILKKELIYPILLECCHYTKDIFWENIFEDLAYGKTPYGTYISKNYLCCRYKKKEFTYKIEKKDPKVLHDEIYSILNQKLGILSNQEKLNKKKDFTEIEANIKGSRKNWSDIRKKNIKKLLLEIYVINMKNKYSLSVKQTKYLLSIILMAIVFKVIIVSDIEIENGYIKNIKGINFTKNNFSINKDLYVMDNFTPSIINYKKTMNCNWEKYLEGVKKLSCK